MNIINEILSDFFNCCNLPVMAVDIDFNEIYSIGYNPIIEKVFNNCNIFRDIQINCDDFISLNLNYKNDINFVIVSISRFNKYRGYFIIGPIKCKSNDNNYMPFKPKHCLEYLPSIILNISDAKFSKGMSNLRFNTYVRKAIYYIHENYTQCINLDDLCNELSINKSYFCKIFKSETSLTFSNFLNNYRIEKSKHLLKSTDLPLIDVAISVGFNTQNYYTMVFKRFTKITPLEYRNGLLVENK